MTMPQPLFTPTPDGQAYDMQPAGGYTQTDILHTLLVRGVRSKRLAQMARDACDAAGNDRLETLFGSLRKGAQ